MIYTTSLKKLREHNACQPGYDAIAKVVCADFEGDFPVLTILNNPDNGPTDAIWALRTLDEPVSVAFAIYCAEPYCNDPAWINWATNWMNGADRSADVAQVASWSARSAQSAARSARAARAAAAEASAWAALAAAGAAAKEGADRTRQKAILTRLLGG